MCWRIPDFFFFFVGRARERETQGEPTVGDLPASWTFPSVSHGHPIIISDGRAEGKVTWRVGGSSGLLHAIRKDKNSHGGETQRNPHPGDPPLDVRGFHEGILTYHTMTHRYKEENER